MNYPTPIAIIPEFLTPQECDLIIGTAERLEWDPGMIGGGGKQIDADGNEGWHGGKRDSKIRQSDIKWIQHGMMGEELDNKITQGINSCNMTSGWNFAWSEVEHHQYTVYHHRDNFDAEWSKAVKDGTAVSGDHYTWHQDSGPFDQGERPGFIRKLSSTIQLSDPDDYEGGTFQYIDPSGIFDQLSTNPRKFNIDQKIQSVPHSAKKRGSLIVFPSYMYHQVKPVTRGTRISLVSWFHGPRHV
tara:strand:- start:18488 stop:19216 length:729 start_codon:yes stop_codon:yes gene_type:complete